MTDTQSDESLRYVQTMPLSKIAWSRVDVAWGAATFDPNAPKVPRTRRQRFAARVWGWRYRISNALYDLAGWLDKPRGSLVRTLADKVDPL